MKVLVAGGAGFIGSNLVDALLAAGHTVVCIDNFFIGTRTNIEHLKGRSNFRLYEQDLAELETLKEIFAKEKFEIVFHMAANSNIQMSAENPEIEYKNTYTTTFCLLECMRIFKVKYLFFCSTSAVYGDTGGKEMSETSGPLMPVSYYGACKLGCEGLISAYTYMNDMHTLIFRFPNVIGKRLTHGVVYDFIKKLEINSKELMILGNGNQCKPYLYVDDLVDCIMQFTKSIPAGLTLFNVGDESHSTVTEIADIVCREMGLRDVAYCYTGGVGGWKGDVACFSYNLDKIHKAGWYATMASNEAIARAVKEVLVCRR